MKKRKNLAKNNIAKKIKATKEYNNKPVLLCGVSSGIFGGARMIEHIKEPSQK